MTAVASDKNFAKDCIRYCGNLCKLPQTVDAEVNITGRQLHSSSSTKSSTQHTYCRTVYTYCTLSFPLLPCLCPFLDTILINLIKHSAEDKKNMESILLHPPASKSATFKWVVSHGFDLLTDRCKMPIFSRFLSSGLN